jgi:hypothetical protein
MRILYAAHAPFVVLFLLFVICLVLANWTKRRRLP